MSLSVFVTAEVSLSKQWTSACSQMTVHDPSAEMSGVMFVSDGWGVTVTLKASMIHMYVLKYEHVKFH